MGSAICLLPRTIKLGMRGNDVLAMKRALSMAGFGKWKPFTKIYGGNMETLLKRFQQRHGLRQDGEYGPTTHRKLAPYFDSYGMKLMNDMAHRLHVENDPANRMVAAALAIYNYCRITGRGQYTQSSLRMSIIRNRWRTPFKNGIFIREDCSSSSTGICWLCNIPDPNHLGYDLQGYTGTFSVHGIRLSIPVIAAFGFYGWSHPYHHMVMVVGFKSGLAYVFSWGSGLPKILPYNYRSDFSHWRGGYVNG